MLLDHDHQFRFEVFDLAIHDRLAQKIPSALTLRNWRWDSRRCFPYLGMTRLLVLVAHFAQQPEYTGKICAEAMNTFERSDHLRLEAARGWLLLGDMGSASNELDAITPELRAHPNVLLLRCDIYSKANKWDYVLTIAETLVQNVPLKARGWIDRSFALHAMKRTQEALDKLLPAADRFLKVGTIHYNLACYCAQLGRLDESEQWFKQAMLIDHRTVQRVAVDDPDLKPLWDSMSGTLWKRTESRWSAS